MKKNSYQDLTTEELRKKEKSLKLSIGVLILGVVSLFFMVLISSIMEGKADWRLLLPISFIPILLHSYGTLKGIKEEIARR